MAPGQRTQQHGDDGRSEQARHDPLDHAAEAPASLTLVAESQLERSVANIRPVALSRSPGLSGPSVLFWTDRRQSRIRHIQSAFAGANSDYRRGQKAPAYLRALMHHLA